MSTYISENQEAFKKKSWINDFMDNTVLAANLTEDYAHDVLEAVGEDYFPSLDEAIADLSLRTGLTASEGENIKRVCIAMVKKAVEIPVIEIKKTEEIPGNKEVPGAQLVKESPEAVASMTPDITAKGMNPGFRAYLDKKKEEKEGKKPTEETEKKEDKKEEKEAEASAKGEKTAWFQGADEPSKEGDITSNNPEKLGYPKEMNYPHKPMETTAPGGQDTRPYEQKTFEGTADETKKVMGPKGKEFELKVEMQRIPKGDKPANASAKRLALIKEIVASENNVDAEKAKQLKDQRAAEEKERNKPTPDAREASSNFRKKIAERMKRVAVSPPDWSKTVEEIAKEYRDKGDSAEEAKSKACATAWKKKNEGKEKGWAD